ncbi:hypothetical protein MIND_00521000 [Mycena indigotica]|uniref:NAD dependent epimerase/dehydratase n=1 Tax=Mycena indigotica TaxID=2126181 RepID=A0A8H6SZP9_9AGAR|nr:uncharacterized protein MIND_00521000 [Mycena indigotica]KAF7307272.1 hypothetical protein MIND_00521000 [Mycena indigotica]
MSGRNIRPPDGYKTQYHRSETLLFTTMSSRYNKVDRRGATRQVPMQVLALGFSRTGTASMRIALETLGYRETNHGFAVWTNFSEMEMWTEAINAKYFGKGKPYGKKEWDALLGHCMAITDVPHLLFAAELIEAYPEAKVILTTRSPDSWWKSYQSTIASSLSSPLGTFNAWLEPATAGRILEFWKLVFLAMFKTTDITEEVAKKRYVEYYDEVRALVPKERLLEYQVGEPGGWDRLCVFLDKKVPEGAPFPKVNDTQAFHDHMKSRVVPIWKRAAKKYLPPVVMVCLFVFAVKAW